RDGVTVTAVAPGFVHTEFHQRMKARTDNIPNALWLMPDQVVADALRAAAKGKAVTVPTFRYKVIVALSRVLPSRLVAAGALRGRCAGPPTGRFSPALPPIAAGRPPASFRPAGSQC